jgi:hypothetical protein
MEKKKKPMNGLITGKSGFFTELRLELLKLIGVKLVFLLF